MINTQFQKDALAVRRERRNMAEAGYELIAENGHPLWEMQRGGRTNHAIVDAVISHDRRSVWIKIEQRLSP